MRKVFIWLYTHFIGTLIVKLQLIFSVLLLLSCGNERSKNFSPAVPAANDSIISSPKKASEDFISVCKSISSSNINQFIHSEKGMWIIDAHGAMPEMRNLKNMEGNFPVDFLNMKKGELPLVNCDSESFWDKEGCFAKEENIFGKGKIWTYCGLSKEEESGIEESAKTILWSVVSTSLNAKYYFALIENKWYLLFADLRTPCEA